MEVALFVLGILGVIGYIAIPVFLYFLVKTFKKHCGDFILLVDNIKQLLDLQESHSVRILELATENATLKSELVALKASNDDLTKSIEILSAQYLS